MASNGCNLATRPVIGLTTYSERAQMMFWDADFVMLHKAYIDALERAGAIAVLLPPQHVDATVAREVVARLDGLVLSGGADVSPALYNQPPGLHSGTPRLDRDAWELALLAAAEEVDLPTLCICRGLQLLNVARGGTLHQHVPDVVASTTHQPALGAFGRVDVTLDATSVAGESLGEAVSVPCHHHQSVDRPGHHLRITGRAADGTVEALEATDRGFLLAVQWHPEQDVQDGRIVSALVRAAQASTPGDYRRSEDG